MGKLISLINTTPDGFCNSEYVNADAEFHGFVQGLLDNTQTVFFGGNSFQLFQGIWPPILENRNKHQSQIDMAQALNDKDKVAFSTTLTTTTWNNSTIARTIDVDHINAFKKNSDRDILSIGSPGLVAALTKLDLVDEYYFSMQPIIAGKGNVRLFDKITLDGRKPLKFQGAHPLKTGVVILHYGYTRASS
jgi:dihydrofolate reductase